MKDRSDPETGPTPCAGERRARLREPALHGHHLSNGIPRQDVGCFSLVGTHETLQQIPTVSGAFGVGIWVLTMVRFVMARDMLRSVTCFFEST